MTFHLSVEQQTMLQDIKVYFHENRNDTATFYCSSLQKTFEAHAFMTGEKRGVIEYTECDNLVLPCNFETIPNITITTFQALLESSFNNTIKNGFDESQFAPRFKVRLQKLVQSREKFK